MTELFSFARRNGEGANQALIRYKIVRQRARAEGLFVMSSEGCALQLLRTSGVSINQMVQLLQPFNTNLPSNGRQLDALLAPMRRMGHIVENTPGWRHPLWTEKRKTPASTRGVMDWRLSFM